MSDRILTVEGLEVSLPVPSGTLNAVQGVSFHVDRGETVCIVGESGCGKSLTALAIMDLLPKRARRVAAELNLLGQPMVGVPETAMSDLRGNRMAMIFQEPMTSLNPAYTVGSQMAEVFTRHRGGTRQAALERAEGLLAKVRITSPGMRLGQYPHQLSGGLRQRVMIAMALMCDPELLVADEPTTALDVTVQAQILRLLADLQAELKLSVLLITHDLGIVARVGHRVSVMYAGKVVESASAKSLFARPMHPYTRGLLSCIPVPGKVKRDQPLGAIPGVVPRVGPDYVGCAFRDRCGHATASCAREVPDQDAGSAHHYACRLPPGWTASEAA